MAKFHGFEIRNMKTFIGMEGYGTQGDVWLNGKKLGFWSDDGNGGEPRFDIPIAAAADLDALVAEQVPECAWKDCGGATVPADLSMVLSHLCDLKDTEKEWGKLDKKGYALVTLSSKESGQSLSYQIPSMGRSHADLLAYIASWADTEADRHELGDYDFKLYDSKKSFVEGPPLAGAEAAIERCAEARAKKEEILARLGA